MNVARPTRTRPPPPEESRTPSSFQAEIYRLQLELFRANQRLINEAVEGYTAEFRRYEERYRRTVKSVVGPATFEDLIAKTLEARVTLVGDYHTLPQSQRTFFRVLRQQPPDDPNVVIALELLPRGHQATIDRFLAGRLGEPAFLRRIDHQTRWPFGSMAAVRPVFELAASRGWRVVGLDIEDPRGATLEQRDAAASEEIASALAPGARAIVLIGELHLAPAHLPRRVARALRDRGLRGQVLRVHQNPERIWFDQARAGVADEHEVLRLDDGGFALLSASPVVCQQSFLTWLDQVREGTVHAPGEADIEASEAHFARAVEILGRALGLPVGDAARRVEIVGPRDLSFFERLRRSGRFTKDEVKQIRAHILSSESYYIPRARLVYLATASINHAAEEASHYLRHHFSGEGLDNPRGLIDAFYSRVLNEAVGFMGSKIVNPKRKCVPLDEIEDLAGVVDLAPPKARPATRRAALRRPSAARSDSPGGEAARFVLAHKQMERGRHVPWLSEVFHAPPALFNEVTHILGYLLGDHLYYGLVRGTISTDEARQLYYEPFDEEGAALMLYFELVARVGALKTPRRP